MTITEKFEFARKRSVLGQNGIRCIKLMVEALDDVAGALVEVGSYKAGTAMTMALSMPDRSVWAFDTFAGMPKTLEWEDHKAGDFMVDWEEVKAAKEFLGVDNLTLVKGDICDTVGEMVQWPVSLAFIDCDLYEPTRVAIAHLWPHMSPGGAMLFEDYAHPDCSGATKAVDEYFKKRNGNCLDISNITMIFKQWALAVKP